MQVAIEKARKVGTGWVSVQHSNHFGIAGYMLSRQEEDMIGIAMTNASAWSHPLFLERMLGTNRSAWPFRPGRTSLCGRPGDYHGCQWQTEILQRKVTKPAGMDPG